MGNAVLLTGEPGCGKTTAILELASLIRSPILGFYTTEFRACGERKGFQINTLDGKHAVLAHVGMVSEVRVGRYGVNVAAVDSVAVPCLQKAIASQVPLVIMDEIGPMETQSERFRSLVLELLSSATVILGTIVLRRTQFTDYIKHLPMVMVVQMQHHQTRCVVSHIEALLRNSGVDI